MVVQGVSTRKVTRIVEELCGKSVSKSFISSLTIQLDQQVEDFLNKKFEIDYPFLFSDVLYLKVREEKRVVSKAFNLVLGISSLYEKRIPKKNTEVVRSELKALFKMTSLEAARTFKKSTSGQVFHPLFSDE